MLRLRWRSGVPVALRSRGAEGADDHVGASHGALDGVAVGQLAGDDREVRMVDRELGRVPRIGADVVAGVQRLAHEFAAYAAGRAEDGSLIPRPPPGCRRSRG